jgi:hypothetical protein
VVGSDGMGAIPGPHHHLVNRRPESQLRGKVEQFTTLKVFGDLVGDSCALKASHSVTVRVPPVCHHPITDRTPDHRHRKPRDGFGQVALQGG